MPGTFLHQEYFSYLNENIIDKGIFGERKEKTQNIPLIDFTLNSIFL